MKRVWTLFFWLLIGGLVLAGAYALYLNRKPAQLQLLPGNMVGESEESQENHGVKETDGSNERQPVHAPGFELENIDGENIRLEDFTGKIVFLNFWTLPCLDYMDEFLDLDEVHKELEVSGTGVVLAVNLGDEPKAVEEFVEKEGLSLPVLLDNDMLVEKNYGVGGTPKTFIIKKDGTVYGILPGATDKATLLEIVGEMEDERNEKE